MEPLVQPGDEKASKTLKLFIFLKKILVCLFPINIRNFWQKRPNFLKKGEKRGEKHTNSNFGGNRQSENFCVTYFSKLNRDQTELKLWRFEDKTVPCRKSRKSETTFR